MLASLQLVDELTVQPSLHRKLLHAQARLGAKDGEAGCEGGLC